MDPREIGIVTFFSSNHAMQGEKVLKKEGFDVQLIPGPKEISPNCGVALQFNYGEKEKIAEILAKKKVKIEAIHSYHKPQEKKSLFGKFWGN